MKSVPLLLSLGTYLLYKLISIYSGSAFWPLFIFLLPISILIINWTLRKKLRYKNWFLSPSNILLDRTKHEISSEISSQLLYEKLIEVIEESPTEIFDTDEERRLILCGTLPNFWTWGENIYINITEAEDQTSVIEFQSVTIYGNTSWGRNKGNHKNFIASFEASLTI